MDNEKIFILVPVYMAEAYLERCIDSIMNQTYHNWELVLVDDGSPDNSGAICDLYAAQYDNITVIHQENSGVSVARNTAVAYAQEHGDESKDWISFIDSDDFVHPKYLEYLYRAAMEAGVAVSSCAYVRTEASEIESTEIEALRYERISPELYLCKNPPNANVAWGKLYRLSLFEDILYPVGKIYEDDATTHKLLFRHSEIAVIWIPLYAWYLNHESISASGWKPARIDKLDALESQLSFFGENGYHAAYKSVVQTLSMNCVMQVRSVRAMSPQYDHLLKEMKQRQRRAIGLYAKEYGYRKTVASLFDIRIRRPLKRMLRDETVFAFLRRKIKKKLGLR